MKIRTALILAGLMLVTCSLFAQARGDDSAMREPTQPITRALKVPVILDGVKFPAGTILPDHGLSFVFEKTADGYDLYAFSDKSVAKEFMRQSVARRTGNKGGVSANSYPDFCEWPYSYSQFHKSVGCGTYGWLTLSPGYEYTQLDSIGWNNSISCVYAACVAEYTVLYSCRNFQMYYDSNCQDPDSLYIPGGNTIFDLNGFGFNNRTSSIRFE